MKFSLRALMISAGLLLTSALAHAQSAAVHGMVLFGNDQLYVSHIPMYMTPHDYQALIKVKISANGLAAYAKYNTPAAGQQYFTIAPKPFVLPTLLNGTLKSFKADLYRGSFEQGGRVIASNITVDVEKIEYQARLSKSTKPASALSYLTLNDGETSYLAHKITAPNNFDHIVQIKWLNAAPVSSFTNTFQTTDLLSSRLKAGQFFTVSANGSIEEALDADQASFQVVSDFYCTQGPDFYNPCD